VISESWKDPEGLEIAKEGVRELTLTFMLAGFSLLGEAISMVEDTSIPTLATDGRKIYCAPAWLRSVRERRGIGYVAFDILHEWLHVFMNHVARRGERDPKVWNIAADMVVVRECSQVLNLAPPDDGVVPPSWSYGRSAEEIYDELMRDPQSIPPNFQPDFKYGEAEGYSAQEETAFHGKFIEELQQAQMIAEKVMGSESHSDALIRSRMQELTKGTLPWQLLLRGDLISQMGQDHATYARPNRRYYPRIILPTFRSYKERVLLVGVDVSASVGDGLLREFIANVTPAAARAEETVIVSFDAVVREKVRTRHPATALRSVKFLQGMHGGTSTKDLFDVVDRVNPTAVVILTDGWIHIPETPYPRTLWVLPENGREQPWGRNYKMRVSW
jgi:predicted metal-dependent peptidase